MPEQTESPQPISSRIGLPGLSLIGRPVAGATFSLAGLRPRAVSTVAWTSSTWVGWTGSLTPSGSVSPSDQAAADPAAGQGEAEAGGPVVPAAGQVDLGRAAELAAAEDDRPLEQLSLLQVAQERGEGRVEDLDLRPVDLVVVDVRIPAIERDLDAAHADFDQPPGGQAAAAERRVAVLFPKALGLLRDVERLELLRAHHHPRAGERLAVQRGVDPVLAAAGEGALEDLQIGDPCRVARGGHAGGDVGQRPLGIVGLEGVEFGTRESRRGWATGRVRIEMCRGISVCPTGSSWQQIAPIDGCSTVGSGR